MEFGSVVPEVSSGVLRANQDFIYEFENSLKTQRIPAEELLKQKQYRSISIQAGS
jgi:hypothetical protein